MDRTIPKYITYAPSRIAGTWRMHETVGHLRNSVRLNDVQAVIRLNEDGTWTEFGPAAVWQEGFE